MGDDFANTLAKVSATYECLYQGHNRMARVSFEPGPCRS